MCRNGENSPPEIERKPILWCSLTKSVLLVLPGGERSGALIHMRHFSARFHENSPLNPTALVGIATWGPFLFSNPTDLLLWIAVCTVPGDKIGFKLAARSFWLRKMKVLHRCFL